MQTGSIPAAVNVSGRASCVGIRHGKSTQGFQMTQQEFDRFKWHVGVKVLYGRNTFEVMFRNFRERLLGLRHPEIDHPFWVRCESVELVESVDAKRE